MSLHGCRAFKVGCVESRLAGVCSSVSQISSGAEWHRGEMCGFCRDTLAPLLVLPLTGCLNLEDIVESSNKFLSLGVLIYKMK